MDTKQPKFGKIVFECGSCGGKIFHVTEMTGCNAMFANASSRLISTNFGHPATPA